MEQVLVTEEDVMRAEGLVDLDFVAEAVKFLFVAADRNKKIRLKENRGSADCSVLLEECFEWLRMHPYECLQVKSSATAAAIKEAYKKLVLKYHPDKSSWSSSSFFQVVTYCHDLLKDKPRRAQHDSAVRAQHTSLKKRKRKNEGTDDALNAFFCQVCEEFASRAIESPCCANLFCFECARILLTQGRPCPTCKKTHKSVPPSASGWLESKFIQNKINQLAPRCTHCNLNVSPDNVDGHKLQCSHLNTSCFKCKGLGHFKALLGTFVRCDVCDGSKVLSGFNWTKCLKCNGNASYSTVNEKVVECNGCDGIGAYEGVHWTKCFKCKGRGAYDTVSGQVVNCTSCGSKGAYEGLKWTQCFICEGHGAYNTVSGKIADCCSCNSTGALKGLWTKCSRCKFGAMSMNGKSIDCVACKGKAGIKSED